MEISLTKEEFLKRLSERINRVRVPNAEEIRESAEKSGDEVISTKVGESGTGIDISGFVGIYMREYLVRIIDTVYNESE